jgi:predicted DNA-binding transcriptional regulator AlpA
MKKFKEIQGDSMPRIKETTRIARETAAMEQPALTFSSSPEILSRKQVARLLQIGQSTLDTRIPPEVLPRIKLGKSVRFLRSDVENFLLRNRIGGTAATLAMKEVAGGFRATKDLDIVLTLENPGF